MKEAVPWIAAIALCAALLAGVAWTTAGGSLATRDGRDRDAYVFEPRPAGADGPLARCVVCHAVAADGTARAAPPLYGIVGAPKARAAYYGYSPALRAAGGAWTEPELDRFLAAPGQFLPGTAMNIAGIRRPDERAAIILALKQSH